MSREALMALQEPILAALTASGLYLALVIWELSLPEVMVMAFLLTRILGLLNKTQRRYQHLQRKKVLIGQCGQRLKRHKPRLKELLVRWCPHCNRESALSM